MLLSKECRGMINATLNANAISDFRVLIGQIGWVTRQTRPDLMVDASTAAPGEPQQGGKALKETSVIPNSLVRCGDLCSGSIKRVCRATLVAESNGFLTGAKAGDYTGHFCWSSNFKIRSSASLNESLPRRSCFA
jgi:hypothetical protein